MNTYIIEGGIGKQVAFTVIIDALVKKDKEKIQEENNRNKVAKMVGT